MAALLCFDSIIFIPEVPKSLKCNLDSDLLSLFQQAPLPCSAAPPSASTRVLLSWIHCHGTLCARALCKYMRAQHGDLQLVYRRRRKIQCICAKVHQICMKSFELVMHAWVGDRAINGPNFGNRYNWHFFASNTISILIFHSFQLPFIAFMLPLRQAISISKLQAVYKRCLPTTYSLTHGSGESCVIGNIYLCHCRY